MTDEKNEPSTADHVGEAAGGITGVIAGASIGSAAGPLGTVLGGIAGAIGGWWSGRALSEAAEDITVADDDYYREHFERASGDRRRYDDAKGAYYLGHIAAVNPDYADRSFDEVEAELSRGWKDGAAVHGQWEAVRQFASVGFERRKGRRRSAD